MFKMTKKRERETQHEAQEVAAELVEDSFDDLSEQAQAPVSRQFAVGQKIRLGVDLSSDRHRRLRTYAAANSSTLLAIIEDWIDEHCPA